MLKESLCYLNGLKKPFHSDLSIIKEAIHKTIAIEVEMIKMATGNLIVEEAILMVEMARITEIVTKITTTEITTTEIKTRIDSEKISKVIATAMVANSRMAAT